MLIMAVRGRDSSGCIVTGYGLNCPGSIPDRARFFSTASRLVLGPTKPPIKWVPIAISPGVNRSGYKADHSPPSRAEVKNGGAITPLLNVFMTYCLLN
jgi:hypothetical protein